MHTTNQPLTTPVAFIVFNRPETTQKVFNEIKKAKPKQLFVIADGARNNNEWKLCKQARDIINQVDWDCEVQKNYSDKNLGCKIRVSSGIDWFFENVEEGIILEDDCVPSQSFFWFCQELLKKYKNDMRIMHISGYNQLPVKIPEESYYFSKYAGIWGWATWKRAWKFYDVDIKNLKIFFKKKQVLNIYKTKNEQKRKLNMLNNVYNKKIDTWDYQWDYAIRINNGLCVKPTINLIQNIGFGPNATHTKTKNRKIEKNIAKNIKFPLTNIDFMIINERKDLQFFNKYLKDNSDFIKKIKIKILKIFIRNKK